MKNITKLKLFTKLKEIGFVPIKFRFNGKIVCIGAAFQHNGKDSNGNSFTNDIITIEPHMYNFYDKKNYHITGVFKDGSFCNNFYRANEIINIIDKLKQTI